MVLQDASVYHSNNLRGISLKPEKDFFIVKGLNSELSVLLENVRFSPLHKYSLFFKGAQLERKYASSINRELFSISNNLNCFFSITKFSGSGVYYDYIYYR